MRIFGIAGWSGAGKSTLITRLLPALSARGLAVATLKHTHHVPSLGDADMRALSAAGAAECLAAGPERWALLHELGTRPEPDLATLASRFAGQDLLLVEGFKFSAHPKIEVWNSELNKPMMAGVEGSVVAQTGPHAVSVPVPWFHRDDIAAIADFIVAFCDVAPAGS